MRALSLVAMPTGLLVCGTLAHTQAMWCASPRQMTGFKPCGDGDKLLRDPALCAPDRIGYAALPPCDAPRTDVAPSAGAAGASEPMVPFPDHWTAFPKTHAQFVRAWNMITSVH